MEEEKLSIQLPEAVVHPKPKYPWEAAQLVARRNPNWRQSAGMTSTFNTLQAVTGGITNQLSPTQLARNIYNIITNKDNWVSQFVFGNNGIVSDKFASENPNLALGANIITDILMGSRTPRLVKRPTIRKSVQTGTRTKSSGTGVQYVADTQSSFSNNAFLDAHFYDQPVKDLITSFQRNRNMQQLEEALKTLPLNQQDQLRTFIKTYKFSATRVPYYTRMQDLLKDHPSIKEALFQNGSIPDGLYESAMFDTGDDWAILLTDKSQGIHEATHALQRRRFFSESNSPYMLKQEDILNKAYQTKSKGGIPEAAAIEEKGAVNQQLRDNLIKRFRESKGRNPNPTELQKYIDQTSDKDLIKLLKNNTNAYGTEYAQQKINFKALRQALKYIGVSSAITLDNK